LQATVFLTVGGAKPDWNGGLHANFYAGFCFRSSVVRFFFPGLRR